MPEFSQMTTQAVWIICIAMLANSPANSETLHILAPANASSLGTFEKTLRNLSRLSLDERCSYGLPFSVAVFSHPPYIKAEKGKRISNEFREYTLSGMIPEILTEIRKTCCHPNARVKFGYVLPSLRDTEDIVRKQLFDFVFPIYGYDVIEDIFRGHAFIRLFQSPSVILLVHGLSSENGQTDSLIMTLGRAWPMLVFILLMASLASMVLWFLEHTSNSKEFPPSFFEGTWEGFWWAFVTMATVGYGDRTPKSMLGRVFAMLWILIGVTTISIFTALVTSSLWASTTPHFRLHGSVIGALNGSEEFRLAVILNAEVKAYSAVQQMLTALTNNLIDGVMIDNYVITEFVEMFYKNQMRTEDSMYYSIAYGTTFAPGSENLVECAKWMLYNYPDKNLQITAANLKPLKNPTDDVSAQFRAAEGLFFQEKTFEFVTYCGMAIVVVLLTIGITWEFWWRRPNIAQLLESTPSVAAGYTSADEEVTLMETATVPAARREIKKMIAKYRAYNDEWIEKIQTICDQEINQNISD